MYFCNFSHWLDNFVMEEDEYEIYEVSISNYYLKGVIFIAYTVNCTYRKKHANKWGYTTFISGRHRKVRLLKCDSTEERCK